MENRVARSWPPDLHDLHMIAVSGVLLPDPKKYPDDGSEIPPYTNFAGRVVRPRWQPCIRCSRRFLSPDRTHARFCDSCRESLVGPNVIA